jgi:hypothetical protein
MEGVMADQQEREARSDGFRDFIVDFLGCLVPGNIFLFFLAPALVIPLLMSVRLIPQFTPFPSIDKPMIESGSMQLATILLILLPVLGFWLMLSYVVGFSFYRKNLEELDRISFWRMSKSGRDGSMCRPLPGAREFRWIFRQVEEIPVQFPYHYLRTYLNERGMTYLADRVPWGTNIKDLEDFGRRSKHFANALKMRIRLEAPVDYTIVAANEGHIRLASSMWHVFKRLRLLGLLGLLTYLSTILAINWPQRTFLISPLIILPAAVTVVAWIGMRGIERAFHHQREREILVILEIANWLCITESARKMFDGLKASGGIASSSAAAKS